MLLDVADAADARRVHSTVRVYDFKVADDGATETSASSMCVRLADSRACVTSA